MLKRVKQAIRWFRPKRPQPSRQQKWDRQWSKPDFAPRWQAAQIPQVLQDAVATHWLPRGGTVLDVGCGSGEIAAWLAGQGFSAMGIDFAPAAIARARATYALANLRFAVVDICQPDPALPQFDILFDRGCLHGLPQTCIPTYAATVASLLPRGGKFLLLHHTLHADRGSSREAAQQQIEQLIAQHFAHAFHIERTQAIDVLTGDAPTSNTTIPGVAFLMVRR